MFNFSNSKLIYKIASKSPAMDNYEIENLISDNYTKKMRGFIAYSAIKPPVEIEIEFICPINIHYISLNTTVGSQKCSGVEIFAKTPTSEYISICKSVYDKPGVVFCNGKFYSTNKCPPNVLSSNYHLAFFKSKTFSYFINANIIKIVIFRTEKSVPCLGSIEVWGKVSRTCSAVTIETINRIMQKAMPDNTVNNPSKTESEKFQIPEDFKDNLTFEIMSIPMTLPSGKTVDQSTLEKHINSEISFGRKPCDPFTGVKFSKTLKPVLNVALKSRIDMFLLQNSHREELFNIKRTLGGISGGTGTNSSSSLGGPRKRKRETVDDLDNLILRAKENPDFISFTSDCDKAVCSECKTETKALYEIPCKHRYCRPCVFKICQDLKCPTCNEIFVKSDVSKCNL